MDNDEEEKIEFSDRRHSVLKYPSEVDYVMAQRAYSYVQFSDGSKMMLSRCMKHWMEKLNASHKFCLVNKSYYIRIRLISDKIKHSFIVVTGRFGQLTIKVSRRGKKALKQMGIFL